MTDNQDNLYRTGSTTPPKGHSGLLAILLVLVILLAGLVSILSLLNIRMFSAFYQAQKQEAAVSLELSQLPSEGDSMNPEEEAAFKSIGITGEAITPVYQQHFDLPEGLFITFVEDGSAAQKQHIQEGDVLLSLDGLPITDEQSLKSFLAQKNPGDLCTARIYRLEDEQQLCVELTIEEIE